MLQFFNSIDYINYIDVVYKKEMLLSISLCSYADLLFIIKPKLKYI